jgi:RNA polymerase sigma-70 factor (ECF subfamily)
MRASDEDLMKRCREGDMSAFELIVLRYKDAIFNFVYHFLMDYHRAQDISQETFLRVLKNVNRYKPRNQFKTWLYRIAVNLCKNDIRYENRHKTLSLDDPDINIDRLAVNLYNTPDKLYEKKEMRNLVKNVLRTIPEDQRLAIIMREYQNLSYEEIASALNCSLGATKSKIYRARQNIKKIIMETKTHEVAL